jgi:hypothetical protein
MATLTSVKFSRFPPTLDRWMTDAPDDHPLYGPLNPAPFVLAFEGILQPLEEAQPLRLSRKRDAFASARTPEAVLEQRAELLAASVLARAEIRFEFGAERPDLLLAGRTGGIEVGSRALDDPRALHDQLEVAIAQQEGVQILLTFDKRLVKLGAENVANIVRAVTEAVWERRDTSLRFDSAGLTVAITTGTGMGPSVVFEGPFFGQPESAALDQHFFEVEREIQNKIDEKARKTYDVPTALLLDFSRVGISWVRPKSVWKTVLSSEFDLAPFVGLGIMVSTLDSPSPFLVHTFLDPAAPPELVEAFSVLERDPMAS